MTKLYKNSSPALFEEILKLTENSIKNKLLSTDIDILDTHQTEFKLLIDEEKDTYCNIKIYYLNI